MIFLVKMSFGFLMCTKTTDMILESENLQGPAVIYLSIEMLPMEKLTTCCKAMAIPPLPFKNTYCLSFLPNFDICYCISRSSHFNGPDFIPHEPISIYLHLRISQYDGEGCKFIFPAQHHLTPATITALFEYICNISS